MIAARPVRRLAGDASGATLVEFALIMPLLVLVVFGIIQIAGLAFAKASIDFAVQEAGRCAAVRADLCGTPAAIEGYAADRSFGVLSADSVSVSTEACGTRISAHARFDLAAILSLPTPTLTGEICTP